MSLKKISPQKKQQLILVGLVTLMLVVALGYGLIRFQLDYVKSLQAQKIAADKELTKMTAEIAAKEKLQMAVQEKSETLAEQEGKMVSGDKLPWLLRTIEQARKEHSKVEIPDTSTITEEDCNLIPKFPYSQVTIGIKGTAHYHDLGRFLADFENNHPHCRIVNLELQPVALGPKENEGRSEALSFQLTLIALVKPG